MKTSIMFVSVFAFVLFLAGSVHADAVLLNVTVLNSDSMLERASDEYINFSIWSNETISKINITWNSEFGDAYIPNTNYTNADNFTFSNVTFSDGPTFRFSLVFENTTNAGLIPNDTWKNFSFLLLTRRPLMMNPALAIKVNGTINNSQNSEKKTINFEYSFSFSGRVKNETGGWQNATNVTMYEVVMGQSGPPTERLLSSVLSNETGHFSFNGVNASGQQYRLKLVYYSNGMAKKTGSLLPPFPLMMFYTMQNMGGEEFMKPPTLDNATYYLEPAATINITANNGTVAQKFGYEIMEQKNGFPIASNIQTSVTNAQIVVALNRNYTVMIVRDPFNFQFAQFCNGMFMNDTHCPSPPRSNSTIVPSSPGEMINVSFDLREYKYNLHGCIGVLGNSTPITNVTSILPRLLPWPGFVPPMRSESGDKNLTNENQLNRSDPRCPNKIARYNLTLMNADYVIEFYATNASGAVGEGGPYFAAFQNITISSNTEFNITTRQLAGSYQNTSGDVNTSKITVNIINSTGSAITTDTPHVELFLKHSSFGQLHYIIETLTNGSFALPILTGTTAKIRLYPNQAPPMEKNLNLSSAVNNITLITMTGGDSGFRKINASGEIEQVNVTEMPIQMRFVRNGDECNVLEPPESCEVTSMNATDFNPLKAMLAGKVNMEMKIVDSGSTIVFMNFDMFSAKQPPMNSIINENASSKSSTSSSSQSLWEFGSFAPSNVYDYAIVKMPYSDTTTDTDYINDGWDINITIPYLYDENWDVTWNKTRGDTDANLTDEYLDYNSSLYRNFLTTTGVACNATSTNLSNNPCFINKTSNNIYMQVPHFSGIGPSINGATTPVEEGGTTTPTGGGGGGTLTQQDETSTTFVAITPGSTNTMFISKDIIKIKKIEFISSVNAANVKLTIKSGATVSDEPEYTYQFNNITHTSLNDTDISSATLYFNVSKSWMENNSLGSDEIYLQRYTGSWNLLDTTLVSESATEIQYRASSPGLSLFAITGVKEVTTQEQEPEPEQQQQSPVCGNSIIESGEECDSSDFGGASCVTRGYDSGTLRCGSSCTFDTSECETTFSPGKQEQPQYDYTGIVIIIVILIIVLVAGSFYYKSLEKKKEKK